MGKNADGFDASHLGHVLNVKAFELVFESLAKVLVEEQAGAKDVVTVLVSQNEVEELRRAKLTLELYTRWEAEVGDARRKGVIVTIFSFWRISIQNSGTDLALHDVARAETEQPVQVALDSYAISELLVVLRHVPVESRVLMLLYH